MLIFCKGIIYCVRALSSNSWEVYHLGEITSRGVTTLIGNHYWKISRGITE
jgi:hypothetical protein